MLNAVATGNYYIHFVALNVEGTRSVGTLTLGPYNVCFNCFDIKNIEDGQTVTLNGKIVTANLVSTDECIYVEEPDRSSGVRVITDNAGFKPGDVVNISGIAASLLPDGVNVAERMIASSSVTLQLSGAPLALLG